MSSEQITTTHPDNDSKHVSNSISKVDEVDKLVDPFFQILQHDDFHYDNQSSTSSLEKALAPVQIRNSMSSIFPGFRKSVSKADIRSHEKLPSSKSKSTLQQASPRSAATSEEVSPLDISPQEQKRTFVWPMFNTVKVAKRPQNEQVELSTDAANPDATIVSPNAGSSATKFPSPTLSLRLGSFLPTIKKKVDDTQESPSYDNVQPVDPKQLTDWLLEQTLADTPYKSSKSLLILDTRTFVAFNDSHILGSFNISLPNIIVNRFKRGSIAFLKIESFICGDEGKERWKSKLESTKIVIVDHKLPKTRHELRGPEYAKSLSTSLIASLEKEFVLGDLKCNFYWLKGGYLGFVEYCSNSYQIVGKENIRLENTRWIDTLDSEMGPQVLPGSGSTSPKSMQNSLSRISETETEKEKPNSNIMNLLSNLKSKSLSKLNFNVIITPDNPLSPLLKDPNSIDSSAILPWLHLGADPAVVTNTSSGLSRSVSRTDIFLDVSSPLSPNPKSPLSEAKSGAFRLNISSTVEKLKKLGVTHVLNVAHECVDLGEVIDKKELKLQFYKKSGMYDNGEDENVERIMEDCVELIHSFQNEKGAKVYVHCRAGRSRSATVVIAYLIKYKKWSLHEAYEHVKLRRPAICPNLGFMEPSKRVASRIGDFAIDLVALSHLFSVPQLTKEAVKSIFSQKTLNEFMSLGKPAWKEVRQQLRSFLTASPPPFDIQTVLIPISDVTSHLPAAIGDYTDFYASKEHASNVGTMFRGRENALMPNWTHLPVGYHGRSSSVVVSGTPVVRPKGQRNVAAKGEPAKTLFGPTVRLDYEFEVGFFIGPGNKLGDSIPVGQALDHVFGAVLLNDWSARDIQAWEYVPLGPFLGKNFMTTISAWVVTMDALESFFVSGPKQDPVPLEYLHDNDKSALDVSLVATLKPRGESESGVVCKTNLKYMYWSIAQQVAHHTVNGCNLRPGDLLGTGTISGTSEDSFGSLLETSWNGTKHIQVTANQTRTFLEDGDELIMTGYAQGNGFRIGFGECSGVIMPSK